MQAMWKRFHTVQFLAYLVSIKLTLTTTEPVDSNPTLLLIILTHHLSLECASVWKWVLWLFYPYKLLTSSPTGLF